MNERAQGGSGMYRDLAPAKYLGLHTVEVTEDAEIREALNVVLGWSEILLDDVLDSDVCRRAVAAIERNARRLGTLRLDDHAEAMAAVDAALRVCADLRESGRA